MSAKQHSENLGKAFARRIERTRERLDNLCRYVQHPSELYYKYVAAKQLAFVMEQPEIQKALQAADREREKNTTATWRKYTHIESYIRLNLRRVYSLGLHKSPPLSILDMGAGAGFFLYLCKLHGHQVMGFDATDTVFYQEMHAALDIQCPPLRILPKTPLPSFGKKFDLISSFAVCFHKIPTGVWSQEDWRFFCTDLLDNHCTEKGRIHLHLNDSPAGDRQDVCDKIAASFPKAVNRYQAIELCSGDAILS